jgi:hypothetical protein
MNTNPVRSAPVTTVTTIEAITAAVLAFLVAHGVIPADVAGTYGPVAAAAMIAAFGAVKWNHVTPVAKVQDILERDGLLTDADLARLEGIVVDLIGGHTVEDVDGPAEATDGMSAGAPEQAAP